MTANIIVCLLCQASTDRQPNVHVQGKMTDKRHPMFLSVFQRTKIYPSTNRQMGSEIARIFKWLSDVSFTIQPCVLFNKLSKSVGEREAIKRYVQCRRQRHCQNPTCATTTGLYYYYTATTTTTVS